MRVIREHWVALSANPKKSGALAILLVVLALMTGRAVLRGGPSSATASTGQTTTKDSSPKVGDAVDLSELGGSGPLQNIARADRLDRNLFVFEEMHFPTPPVESDEPPSDSSKSPDDPDEGKAGKIGPTPEQIRARVEEEARRLTLKSTIVGRRSTAVIEFQEAARTRRSVIGVGQEVEGFILRRILSHKVVLEKEGIEIEIQRELPES